MAFEHPGAIPDDWKTNTTWLLGELCWRLSRRIVNERHGQRCMNCEADKGLITAAHELIQATESAQEPSNDQPT